MSIISVEDLKKEYKITVKKEGLRGAFLSLIKPEYTIKQAVKGVSFNIDEGEMVGYIGANGAGKSTLLKILSKVTAPTTGTIKSSTPFADMILALFL